MISGSKRRLEGRRRLVERLGRRPQRAPAGHQRPAAALRGQRAEAFGAPVGGDEAIEDARDM